MYVLSIKYGSFGVHVQYRETEIYSNFSHSDLEIRKSTVCKAYKAYTDGVRHKLL